MRRRRTRRGRGAARFPPVAPLGRSAGLQRGRRNLIAVWPSLFATSMGLMAFLPVLPLYVHERFGIAYGPELASWSSLIYGAAPFAAAIAGPVWGALGDRTGKKRMAIRANLAIAATTALMPFLSTPLALLAMRLLQGVLAGYVAPAMSLVVQDTPAAHHGRTIATLQVALASGSFLGPTLGAEASHWWGLGSLFWIASALSAVAGLLLHLFAHEDVMPRAAAPTSFVRSFWRTAREVALQPVFGGLLLLLLVLRIGQNMLEPLMALVVQDRGALAWLASAADPPQLALRRTVAVAFMMLAVAQWACTPLWGRLADRHGPLRCLAALALGLGAAFAAMAATTTIEQFLGLRAVVACLMAGSMTLAYAAAAKRVAAANRTFAFAMVQSCIQFGIALGPLLGAFIAGDETSLHFDRAFVCAAALCGVAGIGMLVLRRAAPVP
jgi:DHA1 family multidrug resistance protein-like MFS transporter